MSARHNDSGPTRRRGVVVGALLALVLVLGGLLLSRSARQRPSVAADVPAARTPGAPSPPRFQASATEATEKKPIVIDAITVEKKQVCEGEEVLVTVRAHGPDGTDNDLSIMIPGQPPGPQIPVRVYKDGMQGGLKVHVVSREGEHVQADVPLQIKDCAASRRLGVEMNLVTNSPDEFDFTAQLVEDLVGGKPPEHPFVAKSYEWDFGDGQKAVTEVPTVRHGYLDRPQDRSQTPFLVTLTARSAEGETVVGRRALLLNNNAFEALRQKRIMVLMTRPQPRFPELYADGVVRQQFKIWHFSQTPIKVEAVDVEEVTPVNGVDQSKRRTLPPREVLGTDTIPPGPGITVPVALDTKANPKVRLVNYSLRGTTPEGYRVSGLYSIMVPIKPPTRESGNPITDEAFKARILAAREILKQEFVSDEDIQRLEREGRFRDLPKLAAPEAGN